MFLVDTTFHTIFGSPLSGPVNHDPCKGCSIDSRTIEPGMCFVARKGASVDGHAYLKDVYDRGVRVCIVDQQSLSYVQALPEDVRTALSVYAVPHPEQALIKLAQYCRASMKDIPVIAITGTAGKTTTKELTVAVLKQAGYHVLYTQGNYNTLLGIALTLTRGNSIHTAVVCEVGTGERGEIAHSVGLLQPTLAGITLVGHAHLSGLGSLHEVGQEKRSIFSTFTSTHIGVINGDQEVLTEIGYHHPVIKCGHKRSNHIQARSIQVGPNGVQGFLKVYGTRYPFILPIPQKAWVQNILIVTAFAHQLNIPITTVVEVVAAWKPVPRRFQVRALKHAPGVVIDDSYNANPESMREALRAFDALQVAGEKMVVLGDMRELGPQSAYWHKSLARVLKTTPSIKRALLVGPEMQALHAAVAAEMEALHVASWEEASTYVKQVAPHTAILVKGSFGMSLYRLVDEVVV